MAQESSSSSKLLSQVERLCKAIQDEDDKELRHKEDFDHISRILVASKDKVTASEQDHELSQDKKDEKKDDLLSQDKKDGLGKLLDQVEVALQQCKQQQQQARKKMPSASDCNPFKCRSSSQKQEEEEDDDDDISAVEPLLQQTRNILGDPTDPTDPEKVVYYEWTTSYVDESRIFGLVEEADDVVASLVDGGGKQLFKAAGIVGIHGSGKTALAQKVFVHDRVKDEFPLRLWVCVGPEEDRASLLYRMLDNLGLDTYKIEKIVDESEAVKKATDKDRSKIGVLLFILHVTLYKTGYLIVFDDIRVHGDDGWYSNLTLDPPKDGEWNDRLAYGLPKARKSAVLVTCRKEDDARAMVRTGNVFRPPELGKDDGWKVFERAYKEAKELIANKKKQGQVPSPTGAGEGKAEWQEVEDKLYKELQDMKEEIVDKCLGLPVAIVEAAKGFAELEYEAPDPPGPEAEAAGKTQAGDEADQSAGNEELSLH